MRATSRQRLRSRRPSLVSIPTPPRTWIGGANLHDLRRLQTEATGIHGVRNDLNIDPVESTVRPDSECLCSTSRPFGNRP